MSKGKITMGVQAFGPEIKCPKCFGMTKGLGVRTLLISCEHCKFIIDPTKTILDDSDHAYDSYIDFCKQNFVPSHLMLNKDEFIERIIPLIKEDERLQDGDYADGLTDAQVYELLKIEGLSVNMSSIQIFSGTVIVDFGMLCPYTGTSNKKRMLSFSEMRARAINTYKK